jgi:hypothetical protein
LINKIYFINKMHQRKIEDLSFGEKNEIKFKKFIQEKENIKVNKFRDKYSELDFRCDKRLMELKSRKNSYNRYWDTMCGYNKIIKARKKIAKGYSVEIYFLFTDGLYKWDFKENDFDVRKGGRNDRGEWEEKDYAYIPITSLELISKEIKSIN